MISNQFHKKIDQIKNRWEKIDHLSVEGKIDPEHWKQKQTRSKCTFSIKISCSIVEEKHPDTDKDFKKLEIESLKSSSNGKFSGSCKVVVKIDFSFMN